MHSHVHALGQCRKIIKEHDWTPLIAGDTAGAAREIVEANDVTQASISPPLAAEIYGLEVLARDIEDEEHNTTRFVLLSPEFVQAPAGNGPVVTSSSSTSATCRPRCTRRWAGSPPTAST